jgi:hypothetical protein
MSTESVLTEQHLSTTCIHEMEAQQICGQLSHGSLVRDSSDKSPLIIQEQDNEWVIRESLASGNGCKECDVKVVGP